MISRIRSYRLPIGYKIGLLLMTLSLSGVAGALTIDLEKPTPQVAHQNKVAFENRKTLLGPAVLDARPSFDYAMSHVINASSIRWQDYAQTENPHRGCLDPDYELLSRKLRILGVTPDRPVVIYGKGPQGDGSEGRIAWMLSFLGVKNISVKNFAHETARKTTAALESRLSAPIWLPKVNQNLRATYRDVAGLFEKDHLVKTDVVLVDVREADEFSKSHLPDAVNVSLKLFFNDAGEILGADNVVRVLKERGVDVQKTVIFVSNEGVRSGLATFSTLGSEIHARNYEGGMTEWNGMHQDARHGSHDDTNQK